MTTPMQPRADHGPYLAAVCRHLQAHELLVTVRSATCGSGRRAGVLFVRPDDAAVAGPVVAETVLTWDEESGWSLVARHHGSLESPVAVWQGRDVLPDPGDVASWVVGQIRHRGPAPVPGPRTPPGRGDAAGDGGLEERLARYAPVR